MQAATTYDEWKTWALAEDARTQADRWKRTEASKLYDYKIIRRRYDELVEVRACGDPQRLLYYLNEGLHGNMGGMGAPALYTRARFGTKTLITDYINEMVAALQDLAMTDEREIGFREKRSYFQRAIDCFGRSALMLSGAGSLGAFHVGVAKALIEQDLLPDVISGASAGSVITAILGTHDNATLLEWFSPHNPTGSFGMLSSPTGGAGHTRRIQLGQLKEYIAAAIPDMTFIEALEETGRHINISVAPSQVQQRSRLLNASTSPNAFIREAVLASCAIPGMFPAVTLAARNSAGERKPYVPSRQWVDGSITGDLPVRRLARLYGVNHFISSQTNPIVLWALTDPHTQTDIFSRAASIYQHAAREWMRAIYPFVMDMVSNLYPLNTYMRQLFSVMTQEYTADINIIPRRRLFDPTLLVSTLTAKETQALVVAGEQATWPKIEMIRNCTKVSRCITARLKEMDERYMPG